MESRLPSFLWAIVAIVILIGVYRVVTVQHHRSADQQILRDKVK